MNDTPPGASSLSSHARWWATIAAIAAILTGSLLPGGVLTLALDIAPPVKHLIAYGLLGTLLVLATRAGWLKALALAALIALAGLAIEVLQIFIPDRSFMWIDILATSLGALAGVVFGRFLRWFVR